MLAILQFDAASARLLERLLREDRLPTLAGLRERGVWHDLDAPATQFAAGAQQSKQRWQSSIPFASPRRM